MRNGPRSRGSTMIPNPSIITSPITTPERPQTVPLGNDLSPTTPRALRFPSPETTANGEMDVNGNGPRVTISMDPTDGPSSMTARQGRSRNGQWSTPSSPTDRRSPKSKYRTLSVDGRSEVDSRERRQSQASAHSSTSASGQKKPSLRDFIIGEELGRGSYSTVSYLALDYGLPADAR